MPSYTGPYLAAPDKPQADPAVLHLVDIAKGNVVPAPGWGGGGGGGGGGQVTPGAISAASSTSGGSGAAPNNNSSGRAAVAAAGQLSLPPYAEHEMASNGCCLSPAAHAAGKLTYGIYEGGGGASAATPAATPKRPVLSPVANGREGGGGWRGPGRGRAEVGAERPPGAAATAAGMGEAAAAVAAKALEAQLQAEEQARGGGDADAGAGGGRGLTVAVDYAESALPVVNTPRVALPTPREPMNGTWRTMSMVTPGRERGERGFGGADTAEDYARRKREATAQSDTEMEVALWIEGVTGETFPGKFWSSLKDGGMYTREAATVGGEDVGICMCCLPSRW